MYGKLYQINYKNRDNKKLNGAREYFNIAKCGENGLKTKSTAR